MPSYFIAIPKGTRITVELILRKLAAGKTFHEILTAHPHLTIEDLYAAVAFAADYLAQEEIGLIVFGPHYSTPACRLSEKSYSCANAQ